MPKTKILVIDDSEGMVSLLKRMLGREGCEVIAASDGMEGLKMAEESNPDLIILDLMLPKMDGYKVCSLLKFNKKYQHIPIILVSVKASESDIKIGGEESHADAYLVKPLDEKLLLSTINELLKK